MPGIHETFIMKEIWKNWKQKIMIFWSSESKENVKEYFDFFKITEFFMILGHSMSNCYLLMYDNKKYMYVLKSCLLH